VRRRLIEWTRTYYRVDADPEHLDPIGTLAHRLLLGAVESLALPYEAYKAAFTDAMLQSIYQGRTVGIHLAEEGGYHPHPAQPTAEGSEGIATYWWIPAGRASFDAQKFFQATRVQDPFGNVTSSETDVYALLVETVRDALPAPQTNVVSATNDYRVLQPAAVTDPNGNRSQVAFDALGLIVGTAVMGEDAFGNRLGDYLDDFVADLPTEVRNGHIDDPLHLDPAHDTDPHHILTHASTRLVYDLHRFTEAGQPPVVYTLARETHVADEHSIPSKIQHTFTYSDGFGRVAQTKVQAEPDLGEPTQPRWVATGTTVYNNKGKAVRQFEPFFSPHHHYGIEPHGVSPTVFYDPSERVVCTLHPNHTYEKVVFNPWRQEQWDVNDTVLQTDPNNDPKNDPDVGAFFGRLPDTDYLPTWFAQRQDGALGPQEQDAARKAAVHAKTPTVAHADALGRTFRTVAHNKYKYSNTTEADPPTEAFYHTRVIFDIEGNERAVIDAKDRVVMRYDYDMLGNRIHQASMEAGERWMLNDVAGQPIRAWDSRGHTFRTEYDALRRATRSFVTGADPQDATRELCIQVHIYGEAAVHAQPTLHLRGQLFVLCDGAGVVVYADQNPHTVQEEAYDFKGNPLRTTRHLARKYKQTVDWNSVNWDAVEAALAADPWQVASVLAPLSALLETAPFPSSVTYDALNRPVSVTTPDHSVYRPTFNEANLLERVDVNLRGATANDQPVWTSFVTNLNYNAKGQRELIAYANGATTTYTYDSDTFRLTHLQTTRLPGNDLATQLFQHPDTVQNLQYTYDPAGNITRIADEALLGMVNNNQPVEPACSYRYDALYRLIEARGREHIGQSGFQFTPPDGNYRDYPFVGAAHLNDLQAVRNYKERYEYDPVGNFEQMIHQATNGDWTRSYTYNEPGQPSNRLTSTTIGATTETYSTNGNGYDAHGNMLHMPHLPLMQWDFKDQLQASARQVTNDGTPETTYYVYDAAGQRVRKVTERQNGTRKDERTYLGGFEVYRQYDGAGTGVTLERETLHVMDDKQRIALVETRTQGNEPGVPAQLIRCQLGNHLGSASLELDDVGQIISYEEYYPYGSTSYQAVRSQTETRKRYRYTGKERDEESALYYHRMRYYMAWLGRWTSCDPSGMQDGTNVYQYVMSNPILLIDETGMNGEKKSGSSTKVKLHDVVPYGSELKDRKNIGENAQKDHAIGQAKIKLMRTDPTGKVHYNPKADPTVVVETGKATGSQPAKPHTQKTFHDPQSDVKEIKRLRKQGIKSISGDIVEPSQNASVRSGIDPKAVDKAIWGQLDQLHSSQTLSQTAKEVGGLAAPEKGPPVDPKTGLTKATEDALKSGSNAAGAKTGRPGAAMKMAGRLNSFVGPLNVVSMVAEYLSTGGIGFGVGTDGEPVGVGKYTSRRQEGETQAGIIFIPAAGAETLVKLGKLRDGDYFGAITIVSEEDEFYVYLGQIINGRVIVRRDTFYDPSTNTFVHKIDEALSCFYQSKCA